MEQDDVCVSVCVTPEIAFYMELEVLVVLRLREYGLGTLVVIFSKFSFSLRLSTFDFHIVLAGCILYCLYYSVSIIMRPGHYCHYPMPKHPLPQPINMKGYLSSPILFHPAPFPPFLATST